MKALRFRLIGMPGRVVNHARKLIVRLGAGAEALATFVTAAVAITASSLATGAQCRASSPEGLARTSARQRSSVVTLIPTVCETASTGELSGGNNRATTRSLNF